MPDFEIHPLHRPPEHRNRPRPAAEQILRIVGLFTAALILVLGVIILTGYGLPGYIPQNFRTIMGIIMILYGVYRGAMSWIKVRNANRFES